MYSTCSCNVHFLSSLTKYSPKRCDEQLSQPIVTCLARRFRYIYTEDVHPPACRGTAAPLKPGHPSMLPWPNPFFPKWQNHSASSPASSKIFVWPFRVCLVSPHRAPRQSCSCFWVIYINYRTRSICRFVFGFCYKQKGKQAAQTNQRRQTRVLSKIEKWSISWLANFDYDSRWFLHFWVSVFFLRTANN